MNTETPCPAFLIFLYFFHYTYQVQIYHLHDLPLLFIVHSFPSGRMHGRDLFPLFLFCSLCVPSTWNSKQWSIISFVLCPSLQPQAPGAGEEEPSLGSRVFLW